VVYHGHGGRVARGLSTVEVCDDEKERRWRACLVHVPPGSIPSTYSVPLRGCDSIRLDFGDPLLQS
jgi:hypothetical protein